MESSEGAAVGEAMEVPMVAQAVSAVATVRGPRATVWMVSVPLVVARAAAGMGEEREGLEETAGATAGTVATVGNVPRRP